MRLRLLVVLVLALAGCGSEDDGGRATLWVTRDRGAETLVEAQVPAGVSALAALRREAEVETRYGGRFVQSIDGLGGSVAQQRDWFWFVNGYEGDRSAAEYRLHDGDVLWWDYRSWRTRMSVPVVVGSFPEPFLHGWNGARRRAVVVADAALDEEARALAEVVGADEVARAEPRDREANLLVVETGVRAFRASPRFDTFAAGDPVVFRLTADRATLLRLARQPELVHRRYEGLP